MDLQRARRQAKEDQEKAERLKQDKLKAEKAKEEQKKAERAKEKPVSKPIGKSSEVVKPKPSGAARALPDYYSKNSGPSGGVVTRKREKKESEVSVPSSYYKPKRSQDKNLLAKEDKKEEVKEVKKTVHKPTVSTRSKPSEAKKVPIKKPISSSHELGPSVLDEIPAELLNQIYSEDLDEHEVERLQQREFGNAGQPSINQDKPRAAENRPQRLIGGDVEMEDASYSPVRRIATPPLRNNNPQRNVAQPAHDENEDEMIQRAIEESLRAENHGKFLVLF